MTKRILESFAGRGRVDGTVEKGGGGGGVPGNGGRKERPQNIKIINHISDIPSRERLGNCGAAGVLVVCNRWISPPHPWYHPTTMKIRK